MSGAHKMDERTGSDDQAYPLSGQENKTADRGAAEGEQGSGVGGREGQ